MKLFNVLFKSSPAFLLIMLFNTASAQENKKIRVADPSKPIQLVEAGCAECKMGVKAKSCELAVRIDGKVYFVEGTDIDSHGDAHAADGLCNAVRKAETQGEIAGDKFKVTYFKLLPLEKKEEKPVKKDQ